MADAAGLTGLAAWFCQRFELESAIVEKTVDTSGHWTVPVQSKNKSIATASIPRAIRNSIGGPSIVVVLEDLDPTKLRALREQPPGLLVITGKCISVQQESLTRLAEQASTIILGPEATLQIREGRDEANHNPYLFLCTSHRDQIANFDSAFSQEAACALAPSSKNLPLFIDELTKGLGKTPLKDLRICGTIDASTLNLAFAKWARKRRENLYLVPLGLSHLELPHLTRSRDPSLNDRDLSELECHLAAHELESRSGPLFPDPQVIQAFHLLCNESKTREEKDIASSTVKQSYWAQAARALNWIDQIDTGAPKDLSANPITILARRAWRYRQSGIKLQKSTKKYLNDQSSEFASDSEGIERARTVLRAAGEVLSDHESKVVLRAFGFEITRQAIASSASGAASFAETIGYPVALKAVSPDLRRKSDWGAVKLDLQNAAAVKRAYSAILAALDNPPEGREQGSIRLDGIAVSEMIEPGLELRCGIIKGEQDEAIFYGQPILGSSNKVEPVLAMAPQRPQDAAWFAHAILRRSPYPNLRRSTDPDEQVLAEVLLRLGELWKHCGERILALHLSPIRLLDASNETADGRPYVILDARIEQHAHLEGE